jgi:hypothetical protein
MKNDMSLQRIPGMLMMPLIFFNVGLIGVLLKAWKRKMPDLRLSKAVKYLSPLCSERIINNYYQASVATYIINIHTAKCGLTSNH